jgi:hypothetical protein
MFSNERTLSVLPGICDKSRGKIALWWNQRPEAKVPKPSLPFYFWRDYDAVFKPHIKGKLR